MRVSKRWLAAYLFLFFALSAPVKKGAILAGAGRGQ
jgi:hypothetical protein